MLVLPFHVGDNRYVLAARSVVEVVPQVRLSSLPRAPHYVAGVFDFRGVIIPVIDACQLLLARPCRSCLSTRIIVVGQPDVSGRERLLGLRVEQVTEAVDMAAEGARDPALSSPDTPYLGALTRDTQGILQFFDTQGLLLLAGTSAP